VAAERAEITAGSPRGRRPHLRPAASCCRR
jgi:hypothetical protein